MALNLIGDLRSQVLELREEVEDQKREISKISSLHFAALSEVNAAKRCLVSGRSRCKSKPKLLLSLPLAPLLLGMATPFLHH